MARSPRQVVLDGIRNIRNVKSAKMKLSGESSRISEVLLKGRRRGI